MIAFLDLSSGLSGDMLLGCLIDVGWSVDALQSVLDRLNMPRDAWSVEVRDVMKGPLRASQVSVHVAEDHHHRGLSQVCQIIDNAELSTPVKDRARAIFQRLAHAEAKVHGTTPDIIHFHEVGALDAIVDIVGAVSGLEALHIETLYASAAPLSNGWVDSEHGQLPLPAPATLQLLAAVGAPVQPGPGPGDALAELVRARFRWLDDADLSKTAPGISEDIDAALILNASKCRRTHEQERGLG